MPAMMRFFNCVFLLLAGVVSGTLAGEGAGAVFSFEAKDTFCAVELDCGESFSFKLGNGQRRVFELVSVGARVLYSNLKTPKRAQADGALVYEMRARMLADGEPVELVRYASTQEAFYEPWTVNGVRLWFDGVRDVGAFMTEKHGVCLPRKQARFAFQDATMRLCPERVFLSLEEDASTLPIARIHNGDDTWMGAFLGADAHNGLDVNSPIGAPLFAPIAFDTQFLFESLAKGDDNNRWRAVRTWPDGTRWIWQAHHLLSAFPPEGAPVRGGDVFCEAAGIKYGAHPHTHFMFRVGTSEDMDEAANAGILVDPWMMFWQGFEDRRDERGDVRARMKPLAPAEAGVAVRFSSAVSNGGNGRAIRNRVWTFGDGGISHEAEPTHTYRQSGVYFVTLTVDDGARLAQTTQALTVRANPGFKDDVPDFVLEAPLEEGFEKWMDGVAEVYGQPPARMPARLKWVARKESPTVLERCLVVRWLGAMTLPMLKTRITPIDGNEKQRPPDWLEVMQVASDDGLRVHVRLKADALPAPGRYVVRVNVEAEGALNPKQSFEVELLVPNSPAFPPRSRRVQHPREKIVSCQSPVGFYATPYFWIAPQFQGQPEGVSKPYRMNGGRADPDAFARFAPDLEKGRYRVRFASPTPFAERTRFQVRVRHANGMTTRWVEPAKDRLIGEFSFEEGVEGFVDLLADQAEGQVIADALVFERLSP